MFGYLVGSFGVADYHELPAAARRPQNVFRIDRTAGDHDRSSRRQFSAHRPIGNTELSESLPLQMATCGAPEGKTKAVGVPVADRKAVDGEVTGVDNLSFNQRRELHRDRRPACAPQAGKHADDDVECPLPSMDGHHVRLLAQPQRREETGDAEHVIEMGMRQQNAVKPPKPRTAAQQLALRTLAAIDEDALARSLHEESRMVALRRRNACRGPKECQGEHARQYPGFTAPNATRAAARTEPIDPHQAPVPAGRSKKNAKTTPCTVQIIEEFAPRGGCPARKDGLTRRAKQAQNCMIPDFESASRADAVSGSDGMADRTFSRRMFDTRIDSRLAAERHRHGEARQWRS